MPEMSGFEVLRRLKATEQTNDIPVIVISALDEIDSVVRCIEAGAEDYLTKPFNPTLLQARVGASLEKKWLRDREKKFIAELEQEKRRSETLLLNILPQSIVDRMRSGEMVIADRVAEATILFCDLVGFTTLSHELSADQVIDFLSQIFSGFDRLAAEQGVEKIKTIGDAYMVAAGIPEAQPDHATRVAALSLRMLDEVNAIAAATGLKLQARIGVHSGPIVAGVIGTHKFAYDVWGDTVNTASRMESHSVPGRIQISAATRALLDDRFDFEARGSIEVKGKGMMETFFLGERAKPAAGGSGSHMKRRDFIALVGSAATLAACRARAAAQRYAPDRRAVGKHRERFAGASGRGQIYQSAAGPRLERRPQHCDRLPLGRRRPGTHGDVCERACCS